MKKIVTTQSVDIALRTLYENDRRKVNAWFDHLCNWDHDEYVRRRSHSLAELPGVYLLKTNSDFRIFFRIDDDTITILDITTKQTLLAFSHSAGNG